MVKRGSNVIFQDRNNHLEQVYPPITYFDSYEDLYEKALPGKCNAVFFGDRVHWMNFIRYLMNLGEWTNIYIDEFSEIAPSNVSGTRYRTQQDFAFTMKEVRKCKISVITNSQSTLDIDWRVHSKVQYLIYLSGSKPLRNSLIRKTAISNLSKTESYVEVYGSYFGKVDWTHVILPNEEYQIQAKEPDKTEVRVNEII